ncbi:MAG: metallophosphoesterase [Oscillospiraceae bacterium]|nr:metallophosphoesterase [Oscillospiraceae bacterium]
MSLFVMGDTHLSLGVPEKTMEIFQGWQNYQDRIAENWNRVVRPEDTVVLAGDISWGMSLEQAKPDFAFLEQLPGKKIILKGNHDYWWTSMKKMTEFFQANHFDSLQILHNNCYAYENIAICGTRGWVNIPNDVIITPGRNSEQDHAKILAREQQRLRSSLQSAADLYPELTPFVFLHYPPVYWGNQNLLLLETMREFHVEHCYYGHLHGMTHARALKGWEQGICYHLISGDYLQFVPEKAA